jgi:RNA polymerase sigma-70 factor (ECF subfamily)
MSSPIPPLPARPFEDVLEESRRFLLAIANAELPAGLRAKGGASDLVQETLSAAHRARHQFRGRTLSDLRAWLRTILANELAMFRRHYLETAARDASREVPLGRREVVSHASPAAQLLRRESEQRLACAVARLPDEFRLAVILRTEQELSFFAIGERLGRTEEAARKLFTRALVLLRHETHESTE